MAENEADVIVLGLGGIGSAAAYWLARSGARVIGLERFALGHDRGASQDHSRIIRLSYHDPAYVRLAQAAYAAWAEVAAEAGSELVIKTGGIDIYPATGAFDREAYCSSMDACGVPYERLDAAQAMRRFPELRIEDGDGGRVPGAERHCGRGARERRPPAPGAGARGRSPRARACRCHLDGGRRGVRAGGRDDAARAPARHLRRALDERRAGAARAAAQPDRDARAGAVPGAAGCGRIRARSLPDLDLDERALLLRLPRLRRAGRQGGTGRGRGGDDGRRAVVRAGRGRTARASSSSCGARSRARSAASTCSRPASTRCRPTATSCSTGCPATMTCCSASARATPSSSRRRSGGSSPSSRSRARRPTTSRSSGPIEACSSDPGAPRTWNV